MTTKRISLFALCVLPGLVLLACGGGADNANTAATNTNTNAAGNKNATATASPAANTSGTTAAAGEKIGVPECDEYITKVEACLAKVPPAGQAAVKSSMDTMRTAWKQAAATSQGKAGLAAGCKAALDQAKANYASYGCSW
jgi:hypothetical protein